MSIYHTGGFFHLLTIHIILICVIIFFHGIYAHTFKIDMLTNKTYTHIAHRHRHRHRRQMSVINFRWNLFVSFHIIYIVKFNILWQFAIKQSYYYASDGYIHDFNGINAMCNFMNGKLFRPFPFHSIPFI